MIAEAFYEYITNVFYPWLQKNSVEFPIILFVDGHSLHLTLPLSNFCREHQIKSIALFPNATHILQPLDVAVFHPLKTAWKKTVNHWRLENNGSRLKKEMFAPLLKVALDSISLTKSIKKGFEACGLFPFSANAVNFNVLNTGQSSKKSRPSETCKNEEVPRVDVSENKKHLPLFEQRLSPDLLVAFRESKHTGLWTRETKNEGLFQYWLQLQEFAGIRSRNNKCLMYNIIK